MTTSLILTQFQFLNNPLVNVELEANFFLLKPAKELIRDSESKSTAAVH